MEEFIMNTKIYMGKACLSRLSGLEIKKAYIICLSLIHISEPTRH